MFVKTGVLNVHGCKCHSKEICDEFVTDANKFYKNKKKRKSLIIVLFMLLITFMSLVLVLLIP